MHHPNIQQSLCYHFVIIEDHLQYFENLRNLLNNFPIATQFCIVSNKTGYFLKVAYDEKYKEYGVGNIIHYESIKYMIDHDSIESIDLGAGSEDYKKFWVSDKRQMMRVILFNDSFKGNLLALFNNRILPTFNKYKLLRGIKEIFANRLQ